MTSCASCSAELEPSAGPGRPNVYCSDGCRRFAEFRLRSLTRRMAANEIELREVRAGFGRYFSDVDRKKRVRVLKRWLAQDEVTLRALLGAGNQMARGNNQISGTAAPK